MERIGLHTLVERHVKPGHTVMVVGPGWSMNEDPTLAHVCSRAKKVLVVDSRLGNARLEHELEQLYLESRLMSPQDIRRMHLESGGAGDLAMYLRSLEEFRQTTHTPMVEPKPVYANIMHFPFSDERVDGILDIGTSQFALSAPVALPGAHRARMATARDMRLRAERLAALYAHLLNPKGRAILAFQEGHDVHPEDWMEKRFQKKGLWVRRIRISSEPYMIGVFPHFNSRQYDTALVAVKN